MKTVTVEEFRAHPEQYLAETAQGDVVLTQGGEPWVVLRAVDDDQERLSAEYANSPEFRQMIQDRRAEPSISWESAKLELGLDG